MLAACRRMRLMLADIRQLGDDAANHRARPLPASASSA